MVEPRSKDGPREAPQKKIVMMPTWKTKKAKTSKFVDAESYNRNEREGNYQLVMGRQRRMEKEKNKIITIDTEKFANIETHIKKNNMWKLKQEVGDVLVTNKLMKPGGSNPHS